MAVRVPLDDGTGSDNGIVSVLTPVNLPDRTPAPHVALQLSSATNAGLGSTLVPSDAGAQPVPDVVLHVGSLYLSLRASTARILSRTLVAVAVGTLVWSFPARATALIVTLAVVVGALEFSWLAARISARLSTAYYHAEALRERLMDRREAAMPADGWKAGSAVEEALQNIHAGVSGVNATPMLAERASEADSNAQSQASAALPVDLEAAAPAASPKLECLVTPVARRFFCGRQWLAAVTLALPLAALLVFVEVTAVRAWEAVPSSQVLAVATDADAADLAWSLTFLATTRLAAGVCSLLAPSALVGVLLLAQLELFSVLALLALSCRAGAVVCASSGGAGFPPAFVVGVGALLCANAAGGQEPVAIAVGSALSLSGFLLLHCVGVVAISLIPADTADSSASDAEDAADAARGLLLAAVACAAAAEVAPLVWQATVGRCWDQSTPIQRRLSAAVDVEGALVGAGCAALAAVTATQLLPLPNGGPVLPFVALALAAAAAGRVAELLRVLLKRAAGGGRCPTLDHSAALLAGALVFAQYARAL